MTRPAVRNLPASIRSRLLNRAREQNEEFQLILTQYAIDRLLYRLSASQHADQFILKGAFLVGLWGGGRYRVTRDVDLLKLGSAALEHVEGVFRDLCKATVDVPDGLSFDPDTIQVREIREPNDYDGVRVKMIALLEDARIPVQVDIGFGDAVTPEPDVVELPGFLDLPKTRVRAYPRETVVAEKFQAMVHLGMANTRMKDFYDVWYLATRSTFDGSLLAAALKATFDRRNTPLPDDAPVALGKQFHDDDDKQRQWHAFVARTRVETAPRGLPDVAARIWQFVGPVVVAITSETVETEAVFAGTWPAGGPWELSA